MCCKLQIPHINYGLFRVEVHFSRHLKNVERGEFHSPFKVCILRNFGRIQAGFACDARSILIDKYQ